jgi:HAD superfamily hydrolase (TIGR01662 family)
LRRGLELTGAEPSHDSVVSFLIDLGRFESAVADALCPDADALVPALVTLRRAAVAIGGALARSWQLHASEAGGRIREALRELDRAAEMRLPAVIHPSVLEGFAYYGLHPECYAAAAERFAAGRAPGNAICLGLRSIGAPLSAVVSAVLQPVGWYIESYTVRPRGDPFDRKLLLAPPLASRVARADWCLIVDEGPGLSGSSFAGAAAAAMELGIPRERIVLFPSWHTEGTQLRSATARRLWPSLVRCTVEPGELGFPARLADAAGGRSVEDLSAGRWRPLRLARLPWPAVQPQHERTKYLVHAAPTRLFRFAGLGRYGELRRQRAEWLAAHGVSLPPLELADGYLASRWIGSAATAAAPVRVSIEWLAHYLALLDSQPDVSPGATPDELMGVVRQNVRVALGDRWADLTATRLQRAAHLLDARAVPHDGRMLPQEWVAGGGAVWKTDALDHHDDHFYPGPANVAWDIAGAELELGLSRGEREALLARYAALSGDVDAGRRLPLYRVLYLATRLGYCTLAAEATQGTDDGNRFDRLSQRYRRALRSAVAALDASPWRAPRGIDPLPYDLLIFDADDTLRRTTIAGQPCPYAPDEWQLLPAVRRRLRQLLADHPGLHLGIASNQDRVGYGQLAESTARALLQHLAHAAFGRELPQEAVQLCPHVPAAGCGCRKPRGAMLERIMRYYGAAPERTLFIGNADTDRGAASAAGTAFLPAEIFFRSSGASSPSRSRRTPRPSGEGSYGAGERHATPA